MSEMRMKNGLIFDPDGFSEATKMKLGRSVYNAVVQSLRDKGELPPPKKKRRAARRKQEVKECINRKSR